MPYLQTTCNQPIQMRTLTASFEAESPISLTIQGIYSNNGNDVDIYGEIEVVVVGVSRIDHVDEKKVTFSLKLVKGNFSHPTFAEHPPAVELQEVIDRYAFEGEVDVDTGECKIYAVLTRDHDEIEFRGLTRDQVIERIEGLPAQLSTPAIAFLANAERGDKLKIELDLIHLTLSSYLDGWSIMLTKFKPRI
jgi:hypothetical protein